MKQCPVCKSTAFDDAATCFGCLHKFSDDDPVVEASASALAVGGPAPASEVNEPALVALTPSASESMPIEAPPSFVIQIKPERERSGLTSWTCTVDLLPA